MWSIDASQHVFNRKQIANYIIPSSMYVEGEVYQLAMSKVKFSYC